MADISEDVLELAEGLRLAVSNFVRAVRSGTGTPRTAQSEALGLLEKRAMNVALLAELRNVKHQSMRLVVAQMEREGLVTREPDANDGRSQIVAITATGRRTLQKSRARRAGDIGRMLEQALSADERGTLKTAIAILERVNDAYDHEDRSPVTPQARAKPRRLSDVRD